MKKTLFVLVLLSAAGAFAQSGVGSLNGQINIPYVASHPAHASYAPMASEQSVLGTAGVSMAQGARPFSDFPQPAEISLGTAARELKKREPAKKSAIVWVNQ